MYLPPTVTVTAATPSSDWSTNTLSDPVLSPTSTLHVLLGPGIFLYTHRSTPMSGSTPVPAVSMHVADATLSSPVPYAVDVKPMHCSSVAHADCADGTDSPSMLAQSSENCNPRFSVPFGATYVIVKAAALATEQCTAAVVALDKTRTALGSHDEGRLSDTLRTLTAPPERNDCVVRTVHPSIAWPTTAEREKGSRTGATLKPTRAAESTGPPPRVVVPDEHAADPDDPNAAGPSVTVRSRAPVLPSCVMTAGYSHAENRGIEHVVTPTASCSCVVALELRVHSDAVPKATKSKLAAPGIIA